MRSFTCLRTLILLKQAFLNEARSPAFRHPPADFAYRFYRPRPVPNTVRAVKVGRGTCNTCSYFLAVALAQGLPAATSSRPFPGAPTRGSRYSEAKNYSKGLPMLISLSKVAH
jgi:hypothetical protein